MLGILLQIVLIISAIVGIPAGLITIVSYIKRKTASSDGSMGVDAGSVVIQAFFRTASKIFRICFIVGIISSVIWLVVSRWSCIETAFYQIDECVDGPYYIKAKPLPPEEEQLRKKLVAGLTKSFHGMYSYDRRDAIIVGVKNIEGGVTGRELEKMFGSIFNRMYSDDRRKVIIEVARYIKYPLDDDEMSVLLSGMYSDDKKVCIAVLKEREKETLKHHD